MNTFVLRALIPFLSTAVFGGLLRAESLTTNILDGVTNQIPGAFTLGDTGPFNFLLITNQAALSNSVGTIGNSIDAHSNLAIVTGTNSLWQNRDSFYVGSTGALNQLLMHDGGRVEIAQQAFIGFDPASSNNLISVSGTNTFLDMQWFHLGHAGPGNEIHVSDGAQVGRFISNDLFNRIGFLPTSSGNRLLVEDPGTQWFTDGFQVGTAGSLNEVLVRNGASMIVSFLGVGRELEATGNRVHVHGQSARLDLRQGVTYVGFHGARNLITVDDGGQLTSGQIVVGWSNSAWGNRLEIRGAGLPLVEVPSSTQEIFVGRSGPSNVLSVTAGGVLRPSSVMVGERSSRNRFEVIGGKVVGGLSPRGLVLGDQLGANDNLALLEGPGTHWSNRVNVAVGNAGSGNELVIRNGPVFHQRFGNLSLNIGENAASRSNAVSISGAGTLVEGPVSMNVGLAGSANRLVVSDGARLNGASITIGQSCVARDNFALVTGAGTTWSNGTLEVGFCSTNNSLVISNGAQVLAGLARSSVQGGLSNRIGVTGPQSLLRAAGDLVIGNAGRFAALEVRDGSRVEGRRDGVGLSGFDHTAMLSGPGTAWTNDSLTIGSGGARNHVSITDGADFETGHLALGFFDEADGNLLSLAGHNTIAVIRTNLSLGVFGDSNQLSIVGGADLHARNAYLAASDLTYPPAGFASDGNLLLVSGKGSSMDVQSNLWVGYRGSGNRLVIMDGSQVHSESTLIGVRNGSNNSASVSGSTAQWINTNELVVGSNGAYSSLILSRGATVRSGSAVIGASGELIGGGASCAYLLGNSRAHVADPGTRWNAGSNLVIGGRAIGNSLTISNGAVVATSRLTIGQTTGFFDQTGCPLFQNANEITVDGGEVNVSPFGGLLDVRHGTLTLRSGLVFCGRLTVTNGVYSRVALLGGTLRISDARVRNTPPLIVGDGIHGATLLVEGGDNLVDFIEVRPHSTLRGWGGFFGNHFVTNAGTILHRGAETPRLSFEGPVTQLPGAVLQFELSGPDASGGLGRIWTTTLNLDGSLRVRLLNGFVPAPTHVFRLVSVGMLNGSFTNVAFGDRLKTPDRFGSFLVNTNGRYIELSDYQSTDLDGDGIEDAWASNIFGHSPLTPAEKLADADGDGLSNGDEFKAGTDPLDPSSSLHLSLGYLNGRAIVSFASVEGKQYRVWFSNNLTGWQEVSNPTFAYPEAGRCQWTDDGKDTGGLNAPARFLRVTAE